MIIVVPTNMTKHRQWAYVRQKGLDFAHLLLSPDAQIISLIVSHLSFKIIQITARSSYQRLATLLWVPSLFFFDFICILVAVLAVREAYKRNDALSHLRSAIVASVALLTFFITCTEVSTFLAQRELVVWDMAIVIFREWEDYKGLLKTNQSLTRQIILLHIFLNVFFHAVFILVYDKFIRPNPVRYIGDEEKQVESNLEEGQSFGRHQRITVGNFPRRQNAIIWSMIGTYIVMTLFFRPARPYNSATEPPLYHVSKLVLEGIRREDAYGGTSSDDDLPAITWDNVEYNASAGNSMRNVVVIFVESGRSDMIPFDKTTEWAKKWVVGETPSITPYFHELVREGMYIKDFRSASGYTTKSYMASLCSQYPLPVHRNMESHGKFYRQCLPTILRNKGYATSFFQPQVMSFDHQETLCRDKLGFESIMGKERYIEWAKMSKADVKKRTVNYLGLEDNVMMAPMMDFVDSNYKKKKPFFMTYVTSITHHPYPMPLKPWKPRMYSDEPGINGYLNGLRYTDELIKSLHKEFRERKGLMEETLFVIQGDHGVAFHEMGKWGTYNLQHERAFNVPALFYTENPDWKPVLTRNPYKNQGNSSSLDILPTILDILSGGGVVNAQVPDYEDTERAGAPRSLLDEALVAEGKTLLGRLGSRVLISYANPGGHIVVREGPFILIRPAVEAEEASLYDLTKDRLQKKLPFPISHTKSKKNLDKRLWRWGYIALKFVDALKVDLTEMYRTGTRCRDCSVTFLKDGKTLFDWKGAKSVFA